MEYGGAPPRVLGLDDYFMTEVEKVEKDPDTGRRIKKKVCVFKFKYVTISILFRKKLLYWHSVD